MKMIFYLPVNTDKEKFVAFLVFVCTTALFLAQISSSENVSRQDAIWAPVAKQWIGTLSNENGDGDRNLISPVASLGLPRHESLNN